MADNREFDIWGTRRAHRTLKRRISGWTCCSGRPLTLTRPLPAWTSIVSTALPSSRRPFPSPNAGVRHEPCTGRQRWPSSSCRSIARSASVSTWLLALSPLSVGVGKGIRGSWARTVGVMVRYLARLGDFSLEAGGGFVPSRGPVRAEPLSPFRRRHSCAAPTAQGIGREKKATTRDEQP